jgi:hypothetical protein
MTNRQTIRDHQRTAQTHIPSRLHPIKVPDILCVAMLHIKSKSHKRPPSGDREKSL